MKKILYIIIATLLISSCWVKKLTNWNLTNVSKQEKQELNIKQSEFSQTDMPKAWEEIVIIKTDKWIIKLKLFSKRAPKTVESFKNLISQKFYDQTSFNRIVWGSTIYWWDANWASKIDDKNIIKLEISDELSHIPWALSVEKTIARWWVSLDMKLNQFFISSKNTESLDGKYTIFGQVFEWLDIVESISSIEVDIRDRPLKEVLIQEVTLEKFKI